MTEILAALLLAGGLFFLGYAFLPRHETVDALESCQAANEILRRANDTQLRVITKLWPTEEETP